MAVPIETEIGVWKRYAGDVMAVVVGPGRDAAERIGLADLAPDVVVGYVDHSAGERAAAVGIGQGRRLQKPPGVIGVGGGVAALVGVAGQLARGVVGKAFGGPAERADAIGVLPLFLREPRAGVINVLDVVILEVDRVELADDLSQVVVAIAGSRGLAGGKELLHFLR
jgi:hypothetical protein